MSTGAKVIQAFFWYVGTGSYAKNTTTCIINTDFTRTCWRIDTLRTTVATAPKKVCLFCEHRLSGSRGRCASLVEFRKNSEVVLECLLVSSLCNLRLTRYFFGWSSVWGRGTRRGTRRGSRRGSGGRQVTPFFFFVAFFFLVVVPERIQ